MQTYSSCFHNKTLLHHILKHDRFQQLQLGKAYFRKQRLDNRALGGLCAAAHDIRGSGCSRETDRVLLAHILRLGIGQRGHHAVTRTDRTADRNLESLSVNRAALAQIQRTAAAQRDNHPFDTALQQLLTFCGQFFDGFQFSARQTRQFIIIRLDEVRRGL